MEGDRQGHNKSEQPRSRRPDVGSRPASDPRKDLGRLGEDLAARFLERQGYRVVRRNYRCPGGELDLVVEGADGLVVVEVRTRQLPCLVRPEESITREKASRLVKAALHYLAATGQEERPWRVDLVAIEMGPSGRAPRIVRFPNATADLVGP